jgi:hypothetical protein
MPFVPIATIDRTHSTSEGEATLAEPGSEVPRIAAPRVLVELLDSRLLCACARLKTLPVPRLGCPASSSTMGTFRIYPARAATCAYVPTRVRGVCV